jgi:hypothetical protein
MSNLMQTQMAILKATNKKGSELSALIRQKGLDLRYLAGAVISKSLTTQTASKLLINY